MMKKYILVFIANFLTIPLFSASFAESIYADKRHEVSISYGILPITGWMDTFTDLFSDAITGAIEGAQTRSRNSTSWGALNLMYKSDKPKSCFRSHIFLFRNERRHLF